jgi:hypothetical protein
LVFTTRNELANLWLPWCVARKERSVPIVHLPTDHPSALQLRMTDLDDEATQRALAWQPLDTETSWQRIARRAHEFRHRASSGEPLAVGPAPADPTQDPAIYEFDDVRMLHEGCHRVCALYVAGVEPFHLEVRVDPLGWEAYRNPALRRR